MTATTDLIADALAAVKIPKWAVAIEDWEFDGQVASRDVRGQVYEAQECLIPDSEPFSAHVYLSQFQSSDGRPSEPDIELMLRHPWAEMTAASARSLANALLSAADELDGPRPIGAHGSAGEAQHVVVQAIRKRMKLLDMRQDHLAVSAGYGLDEMSSFMVGTRAMDLTDLVRIAQALGCEPTDLIAHERD